jgi:tripartite-type tricarboxylate transporter receptor subunit TctC
MPHSKKGTSKRQHFYRAALGVIAISSALLTPYSHAQPANTFPIIGKPIRIVVPFPAGSGSDINARVIAKQMSELLNGHTVVARAPADGHTLLYTIVITHTQNPHLYSKLPYDPIKDFTPLTQVMKSATVLIAHPSAPFNNIAELVAHAKANPEKLSFASFSAGSTSHLNGELLMQKAGIKMVHVPYKGTSDATRGLVGGEVQLYFDGTATAVQMIKAGKAKGLGTATPTRLSVIPDLPTISEQGVAGLDIVGWQGLFGPGNMSPALATQVGALLKKISTSPEMLKMIEQQGNEPSGASGADFANIVKRDYERWGEVIRAAKVKLD